MYYLKLYDEKIAKFNMLYDEFGFRVKNLELISEKYKLPLNLEFTNKGMKNFLKRRIASKNREFVDKLLSKIGLNYNNTKAIIDVCKGLSLNDSYWICDDLFTKDFSKCNLYENPISNIIALMAFNGYGTSINSKFISSPEFTTNGQLAKCWRRINGNIYLFKLGSFGFRNSGLEPFSEFYSSQIAQVMLVNHVEYNLEKWKGKICSTCKLFTDIDHSYIPIGYLVKEGGFTAVFDYIKNLGDDFFNDFLDMIVFDAIIMNTDRHYGNFGLIIDNKTNKPISLAPIFDNGAGLLVYGMDDDEFSSLEKTIDYANTRYPIMYSDFIIVAKKYMTKRQYDKVKKLINFKFKKHIRYNLSDKRLNLLEKIIQLRVEELLK